MRRPKILLVLIGAILLFGGGVALATFGGTEDEKVSAVYELDTSSENEGDDEAGTTTSEEETTSEAKKTKKTKAEKAAEKAERKKNKVKKGGKGGGGKGGASRGGRGGNALLGQGSGGYSYGAAPANAATPTGGGSSNTPNTGETTTASNPETESALTGQDPSSVPGSGETEGGITQPGDVPPGEGPNNVLGQEEADEGDTSLEPDTENASIVQYPTPGQEEVPEGGVLNTAPKASAPARG